MKSLYAIYGLAIASISTVAIASYSTKWNPVSIAPKALVAAISQETSAPPSDIPKMSYLNVSAKGAGTVTLVNTRVSTRTPEGTTCGAKGCLLLAFAVFNGKYKTVFGQYFISRVPEQEGFVKADGIKNGLPCLRFNSPIAWGELKPWVATYCYDGKQYR
jgi:hypothetical protein